MNPLLNLWEARLKELEESLKQSGRTALEADELVDKLEKTDPEMAAKLKTMCDDMMERVDNYLDSLDQD